MHACGDLPASCPERRHLWRREFFITTVRLMRHGRPAAPTPVEIAVLAALADPNRLRLLRLLLEEERCVTQCVDQTGLVQSLVSKHLARLIQVGLVQRRRVGRRNYHSVVDPEGVSELLDAAGRLGRT